MNLVHPVSTNETLTEYEQYNSNIKDKENGISVSESNGDYGKNSYSPKQSRILRTLLWQDRIVNSILCNIRNW